LKEEDGGEKRYKARLVVKGFAQKNIFSMGIWRKRFICNSHRRMRSKGRRIWYAG
jgi:hypothetical protein